MASQSSQEQADPTFRNYSPKQAAAYSEARKGYSPALIEYIIKHHRTTGGQTDLLLDVGCGPGNATRDFSPYFSKAVGADPGEAMIQVATDLAGTTSTGAPIEWRVSAAEDIDKIPGLQHGSVDMITAATAAHWFDMPKFWEAAAKVLKPGGTVAIWVAFAPSNYVDPVNPNADKLLELFLHFREVVLGPYITPGNRLASTGYEGLEMPWDREQTAALFEKDTFLHRAWMSGKETSDGKDVFDSTARKEWPLSVAEKMLSVSSPVTRWREAHPELAGTDQDCLKVHLRQICEVMGVPKGEEDKASIHAAVGISLFCIKRAGLNE